MATVDLGKIKFKWRGAYNASTAYVVDDVVESNGSSYVCILASTGNTPPNATYWELMAEKGADTSVLTTRGDVLFHNGSTLTRLPAGTSGQYLETKGSGADPVWSTLTEYNDAQLQNNIALLAFKLQTTNSLSKFGLDDQYIDEFTDNTGIDVSGSTNERKKSGGFVGLTGDINWWGDGSDGAGSINSDTNLEVQNPQGAYDGDMVIANYTSLTIGAGSTLSTSQPCRGLFIFVDGDCTINGTISMRGRGPFADPTTAGGSDNGVVNSNGLQIPYLKSASSETLATVDLAGTGNAGVTLASNLPTLSSNGYIFNVDRQGNNGGSAVSGSAANGNSGASGGNKTGGGGSGGAHDAGTSGAGNYGSCFGGGSAGGGARTGTGGTAVAFSGAGGDDGGTNASGGQGNPKGNNHSNVTNFTTDPEGVGGLVGLFVRGNLTIGSSGGIDCRGSEADAGGSEGGGGSSGSGAILIGYAGTLTNNGTLNVSSVPGNPNTGNGDGGAGGAGMTETQQVDEAPGTEANMTLVSNTFTANAIPTTGDFVMQYTDSTGTATLNTDIKAYISRDNGSTFTEGTLVAEGTPTGGKKLATFHNLTLGGTGSTNLKWKVETLNQSASKVTRVDSVAIGWSS